MDKSRIRLVMKKINLNDDSNIQLKRHLDDLMNSSENYFNTTFSVEQTKNFLTPKNDSSSVGNFQRKKMKICFSLNPTKEKEEIPLIEKKIYRERGRKKTTKSTYSKNYDKVKYMNDREVMEIFDKFKSISSQRDSSDDNQNKFYHYNPLKEQQNALLPYNHHIHQNNLFQKKLCIKLHKKKTSLLINQSSTARIRNEFKILNEKVSRNKIFWYESLRQPIPTHTLQPDDRIKNLGTLQHPHWQVLPKHFLTEVVRAPTMSNSTDSANQLAGLHIVGRNLLNVEYEQFNKMRLTNRKFLYCP